MKVLVTGCAGFIGSHVCERLCKLGHIVVGVDNMNDYYDVSVKQLNVELLKKYDNFRFIKKDVCELYLEEFVPDSICHLASMAGVRYSIKHPGLYVSQNIGGFINILENARRLGVRHVVYASSSSVYGLNETPFREDDLIEKCNSPYACSKRSMEIFASTYSRLYDMSLIGLRFFTVYGPRGRPDMAPYKFMKAILEGETFNVYGDGSSSRDYTYIDDIVSGVLSAIENKRDIKCGVYNLGNSKPIRLLEFIKLIERVTGKRAIYEHIGEQLGDVPDTYADINRAIIDLDYKPSVSLEDGLTQLYEWFNTVMCKK